VVPHTANGSSPAGIDLEAPRAMLTTVVVWLALLRDKRGLLTLGAFLLFVAIGVIAWNLIP
jgi:hypothetical protein